MVVRGAMRTGGPRLKWTGLERRILDSKSDTLTMWPPFVLAEGGEAIYKRKDRKAEEG